MSHDEHRTFRAELRRDVIAAAAALTVVFLGCALVAHISKRKHPAIRSWL